jgi:hypothetical protein
MSYRKILIEAAEGDPLPVLDYMALRNKQWLTEWYIKRARMRYNAALKQDAQVTPQPDIPRPWLTATSTTSKRAVAWLMKIGQSGISRPFTSL